MAIVVFSDLVDSTALLARLGDDRMEEVRRAHVADVRGAVEERGGRLVKTLGDGAMASFDSALGALRAAAEIQASVKRLDEAFGEIGVAARVGVAAGEPIADGDDLHGMPVVIASRLCSAASTGEVLVQDIVHSLVASRDGLTLEAPRELELKGVPVPVRAAALRWRDLSPPPTGNEQALPPAAEREPSLERPRLPSLLAAYGEEPLIGRDEEAAALRESIARGGQRAVLVLGEPGIGKTRIAAAGAAEAHADGTVVALARCPAEAVVPFEPWVRAIGQLAHSGDEEWRRTLAKAAGPELSALVPELSEHAVVPEQTTANEMVAAEGARYRLLRGIAAALGRAAGDSPLLVVFDDAHWCDPASAQALGHLLENGPNRLALVVTAREADLGRGHPVSRVLTDLRRTGCLTELRLRGLDTEGMAKLVGTRLGRAITPRLAARLQARTAGNPFFAGELARDLEESGNLRDAAALEAAPVPDAVADLVEERLARLAPTTEGLLGAAAAIGPQAPVALAARAAGLSNEEAEEAVREALSERLVEEVPSSERVIAFPHALIRESLEARSSEVERARLHLGLAEAIAEDPEAEPEDLARHYGEAVPIAGPERAIDAYRAAALAAAEAHDHERAATHLRRQLDLIDPSHLAQRSRLLLELGEQELLAADLVQARGSFREAADAARRIGDVETVARAALGFAGGDIGFGWEIDSGDTSTREFLEEGLAALGDSHPRLALQIVTRLSYVLAYTDDDVILGELTERANSLHQQLGDVESQLLARYTTVMAKMIRGADPLRPLDHAEEGLDLLPLAEECGREDLLFRVVGASATFNYLLRRIPECEAAVEQAAEIAARLGSPRFSWEVDLLRGQRLLERGDREAGEALIRRAGAVVRRIRPDIQMMIELTFLPWVGWLHDARTATLRAASEAIATVATGGLFMAIPATTAALDGDHEEARRRLRKAMDEGLPALRRPDAHLPTALWYLAYTATLTGDRAAAEWLRPLLEVQRPYLLSPLPAISFGGPPEWMIGRIDLLLGDLESATRELRTMIDQMDKAGLAGASAGGRVDLAVALHRQGSDEEARAVLAEAEERIDARGFAWVRREAAIARAEMEGRPAPQPSSRQAPRAKPVRALAARTGRRVLAARLAGQEDAEIERRFADPRRQRALLRAMARGFQPAFAEGVRAVVAYELEPYAIEVPPDAPWRWALEIDGRAGRAQLLEPAPLDAEVTIHFGLADWVRVITGEKDALTTMVAGRCSVEGDAILAARLEAMFGAR